MGRTDHKIVTFREHRNKIEPKHAGRSLCRDATIGLAGQHVPGGGQVPEGNLAVTAHRLSGDAELREIVVQHKPAARARLAIHNRNGFAREVGNRVDSLGVA